MPSEFAGYPFHLALCVREHGAIVGRLFNFIGRPRLREPLLELVEIVGAYRATLSAQHYESHGAIEPRYLRFGERARDLFGQTEPRYALALSIALFHVVIDLHLAIPHGDIAG
jgi:hypothetical protein